MRNGQLTASQSAACHGTMSGSTAAKPRRSTTCLVLAGDALMPPQTAAVAQDFGVCVGERNGPGGAVTKLGERACIHWWTVCKSNSAGLQLSTYPPTCCRGRSMQRIPSMGSRIASPTAPHCIDADMSTQRVPYQAGQHGRRERPRRPRRAAEHLRTRLPTSAANPTTVMALEPGVPTAPRLWDSVFLSGLYQDFARRTAAVSGRRATPSPPRSGQAAKQPDGGGRSP